MLIDEAKKYNGICSYLTLTNNFSNLFGRMLEIKCTTTREIYKSGKIKGIKLPYSQNIPEGYV